jgi:hypothetical protein
MKSIAVMLTVLLSGCGGYTKIGPYVKNVHVTDDGNLRVLRCYVEIGPGVFGPTAEEKNCRVKDIR